MDFRARSGRVGDLSFRAAVVRVVSRTIFAFSPSLPQGSVSIYIAPQVCRLIFNVSQTAVFRVSSPPR